MQVQLSSWRIRVKEFIKKKKGYIFLIEGEGGVTRLKGNLGYLHVYRG